jgi:hypothetical protein
MARKPTGRPTGRPNKRALPMGEWLGTPQIIFDERGRPVGTRTSPAEYEKAVPEHWERMLAVEIDAVGLWAVSVAGSGGKGRAPAGANAVGRDRSCWRTCWSPNMRIAEWIESA